jgi:hypothetical protein
VKILPCPFCKETDIEVLKENPQDANSDFYSFCFSCEARGAYCGLEVNAIKEWNYVSLCVSESEERVK